MRILTLKKSAALALTAILTLSAAACAKTKELFIDGDHGKLAAVMQIPEGKSQYPMVMLFHGFTSEKEFPLLVKLSNNLEAAGIASIRFDFNGHGKSEGRFQDMTVLNEIGDAEKVYDYVSKMPEITSVSIAGHSQGGVVASKKAGKLATGKVKSLVLMAPAAVLRDDSARGIIFGVSCDVDNLPEYVEIFGGHKVGRKYIEAAIDLPIYETAAQYQGPVCIIHGRGDHTVPFTYSQHYHKIYQSSELHLLKGLDHCFLPDDDKAARIAADFLIEELNQK